MKLWGNFWLKMCKKMLKNVKDLVCLVRLMKMGTRGLDDVSDGEVLVQSSVLECRFVDSSIPLTVMGHRVRSVVFQDFKTLQK